MWTQNPLCKSVQGLNSRHIQKAKERYREVKNTSEVQNNKTREMLEYRTFV